MKIPASILRSLCIVGMLSLGVQAQDNAPPRRIPQLTMDDFDNRSAVVAPVSSSSLVVSGDSVTAAAVGKSSAGTPRLASPTNAKAALEAAWKRMSYLKSGRMHFTNKSTSGLTEMYYEFAPAGQIRIVKDGTEIIVIASTVYINVGGQGWKKATKEAIFKSADLSFKSFANIPSDPTEQIQWTGEESLQQRPMWKFKVTDSKGSINYTWVGKNDGLVYKMEATVPRSGEFITTTFSDFNADIVIAPPGQ